MDLRFAVEINLWYIELVDWKINWRPVRFVFVRATKCIENAFFFKPLQTWIKFELVILHDLSFIHTIYRFYLSNMYLQTSNSCIYIYLLEHPRSNPYVFSTITLFSFFSCSLFCVKNAYGSPLSMHVIRMYVYLKKVTVHIFYCYVGKIEKYYSYFIGR